MGKKKKKKRKEQKKRVRQILPDILCIIALILLRIMAAQICGLMPAGNTVFFEMAQTHGGAVPFMKHGASYVYTCFLSVLLYFFGNRGEVVTIAQLVIQAGMILMIYRAVGKLWGRAASLFFLLAAAVLPDFLTRYPIISPDLLLCVMTGLLLLLTASLFRRMQEEKKLWTGVDAFIIGVLAGFCLWLDITGIVIWLAVCIGIIIHKKGMPLLYLFLGIAGSLAVFFITESLMTGISLPDTVLQYCALYFRIPDVTPLSYPEQADIGWMSKVYVRYGNLAAIWALLAGSAIVGCFARICAKKTETKPDVEKKRHRHGTRKQQAVGRGDAGGGNMVGMTEETDGDERDEGEKINYIPNPLPLPKKHVKKVIGFDYEPEPHKMRFDVETKDGDDFDLT